MNLIFLSKDLVMISVNQGSFERMQVDVIFGVCSLLLVVFLCNNFEIIFGSQVRFEEMEDDVIVVVGFLLILMVLSNGCVLMIVNEDIFGSM